VAAVTVNILASTVPPFSVPLVRNGQAFPPPFPPFRESPTLAEGDAGYQTVNFFSRPHKERMSPPPFSGMKSRTSCQKQGYNLPSSFLGSYGIPSPLPGSWSRQPPSLPSPSGAGKTNRHRFFSLSVAPLSDRCPWNGLFLQ